jgi:flagellar biosynthesis protein FlhA
MQKLLETLDPDHRKMLNEMSPGRVSHSTIQKVLQNLLGELVSIRDIALILEAIAEASDGGARSPYSLTEAVRRRICWQIGRSYVARDGMLPAMVFNAATERMFMDGISGPEEERVISIPPSEMQKIIMSLRQHWQTMRSADITPVLVVSSSIRREIMMILRQGGLQIPVLGDQEIHPKVHMKTVAVI